METQALNLPQAFLGSAPWVWVLEVAVRAAVMCVALLLLAPRVWRRGASSPVEIALLVMAGVIAGYATLAREVPLLAALAGVIVVAGLQWLAALPGISRLFQRAGSGEALRVAHNGRLEPNALRAARMSHEALFRALRLAGITHLGQVKAAYAETGGRISVLRCSAVEERPGLPVMPQGDGSMRGVRLRHAMNAGAYACSVCGQVLELNAGAAFIECPSCSGRKWVPALGDSLRESSYSEDRVVVAEKVQ